MKLTFLKTLLLFSCMHSLICMDNKSCSHARAIVYAPWRKNHVYTDVDDSLSCKLCSLAHKKNDKKALILHRGNYNLIVMNSNPYIYDGVHLMIVPYFHEKHLYKIPEYARKEALKFSHIIHQCLSQRCYEVNSNYNIGKNASASIPEHLHQHIIGDYEPRCYNLIEAIENQSPKTINLKFRYKILKHLFSQKINTLPLTMLRSSSCYYCKKLQENSLEKNLIIHEGKYSSIMFDHNPFCPGHLSIISHNHYEQQEQIPYDTLQEMDDFAVKIYPILLSLLNIDDINIGMVSYGANTLQRDHIKLQLIPRQETPSLLPALNKYNIHEDIPLLYEKLVKKFKKEEKNKN